LVIGPTDLFVIDSKQWTGSVHQSADGLAWHNHHPLDRILDTVCWEAEAVGRLTAGKAAGGTLNGQRDAQGRVVGCPWSPTAMAVRQACL
jgi:hypothetical protein